MIVAAPLITGNTADFSRGFLRISEQQYEIQRTYSHFPDLQTFVQRLEPAYKSQQLAKRPPKQVAVLLLYWKDDDLGVKREVNTLVSMFRTTYRFQTDTWAIPSGKGRVLDTVNRIGDFVHSKDKDGNDVDC